MITHILCPVDFSADSERALAAALGLARAIAATVSLITVVDPVLYGGAAAAGAEDEIDRQTQAELRTLLQRVDTGGAPPKMTVAVGAPADEILKHAKAAKADLIVMGRRGVGLAEAFLLGSVSEAVLQRSHVPVMVVPVVEKEK